MTIALASLLTCVFFVVFGFLVYAIYSPNELGSAPKWAWIFSGIGQVIMAIALFSMPFSGLALVWANVVWPK